MTSAEQWQIVLIVILVVFSAFFSATEMAFASVNRIRLKNAAENGDKRSAAVLKMAENFDKFLSTVLVGNNIVNILASSIGTVLFVSLLNDSAKGSTVSTAVLTIVILIFGEVAPKCIAKANPEKFAKLVYPIIKFFSYVFYPIAIILIGITKLVSLIFRSEKNGEEGMITEEEIITFVEEAELEGSIGEQESELIRSAVEFNDREAQEILTHRVDIEAVSDEASMEEIKELFMETGFSRLPIYHETIDNITGVIHHKDFYNKVVAGDRSFKDIIKPVVSTHKAMKIRDLLNLLQKSKTHMAVIADDYGGTLGIVTMEDIIEELVGEIWDEHDEVVEEIVELEKNKYRILCTASLDSVFSAFDIRIESDETSVGGWVTSELDKLPEEGDSFKDGNVEVTVTKTDGRRVLEIEAIVTPDEADGDDEGDEERPSDKDEEQLHI